MPSSPFRFLLSLFTVLVVVAATVPASFAQTFTTLKNFRPPLGEYPGGPLVQTRSGTLVGTTSRGGTAGVGTIFDSTLNGTFLGVFNFDDSNYGSGNVEFTLGPDGNLYGATSGGRPSQNGIVLRVTTNGFVQTIYTFPGGAGGALPLGSLTLGRDGNFYGTTMSGGATNQGTVYRISLSGQAEVIYSFGGYGPSAFPSSLTLGPDGNFYGTTQNGPSGNIYGTVFKINEAGLLRTLYEFTQYPNYPSFAALTLGNDGNFYGTTPYGGNSKYGSIYKITPSGSYSDFYLFAGTDGANPYTGPIVASDGNFYGVTYAGGANGGGEIYQLTPGGTLSVLYSFDYPTGSEPYFLTQDTNGMFYGTTTTGGLGGGDAGTLYSFNTNLQPYAGLLPNFGRPGQIISILGQGLTGATSVSFNGTPAASFTVVSNTFMTAKIPSGATTGPVTVSTPGGALTSAVNFIVE